MTTENTTPEIAPVKKVPIFKRPFFRTGALIVLALAVSGTILYLVNSSYRVSIDSSMIVAPQINLSASAPGTLDAVYVHEGDSVSANAVVAKVGGDLIKTKVAGTIIMVQNNIGKTFNPGETVVAMIDPTTLRAVGTIDENKGLSRIAVGEPVSFTVDAFGSKKYVGIVDEVSATAHQTGVVFNISDERPTQQFDIKVRFNQNDYPELKNGMSAKMNVFVR